MTLHEMIKRDRHEQIRIRKRCEPALLDMSCSDVTSSVDSVLRDDATFIQDVSQFYNRRELSDVELVVGGDKFYAHKFVLAKSSDVFRTMLYERSWDEDQKAEIELNESAECQVCFDKFLRYLYTAEVAVNAASAVGILCLADKYNVDSLKELCVGYMVAHSCSPNVHAALNWYPWAKALHLRPLQVQCANTIAWNFQGIIRSPDWCSMSLDFVQDFLQSSELIVPSEFALWQAVCCWLLDKSRAGELEDNAAHLLPQLRFPQMVVSELYHIEQSDMAAKPECKALVERLVSRAYRFRSLCPSQDVLKPEISFQEAFYQPRDYTDLTVDNVRIQNTLRFGIQVDVKMYKGAVPHESREADWKITYRKQADTWQLQLFCHETGLVHNVARVKPSVVIYNEDDQVVQVHREATSLLCRGSTLTVQTTLQHPAISRHMAVLIKPVPA